MDGGLDARRPIKRVKDGKVGRTARGLEPALKVAAERDLDQPHGVSQEAERQVRRRRVRFQTPISKTFVRS
jgi:hypothetical protein